jgi:hypothetical protein
MERVHHAVIHGGRGRRQRLSEHLPAEDLRAADVAALAAEQVVLEPLELEQLQQIGQSPIGRHQSGTPSRWCITGLVVVYCRNCFFCGYRWCWTANAASAAS